MQPFIEKDSSHSEVSHEAEEGQVVDIAPPIGRTSRPVYRSVVLGSLLVLAMLVTGITHGGVAVAASVPAFLLVHQTIGVATLTDTSLHTAIADHSLFVFARSNVVAINVTTTIRLDLPVFGPVTLITHIDRLVIHGLVSTAKFPGASPPSVLSTDLAWDSATFEGVTISIIRP
jgi:hypothetical protein